MNHSFEEKINRRGTNCYKWDAMEKNFGRDDLIAMWVADMDIPTPPFVMNALRRKLDEQVMGYQRTDPDWAPAVCRWQHRRHRWDVTPEMLTFVPGVVRGQAYSVLCFTNPGDKVLVMSPVYHPFFLVTEGFNREVVFHSLTLRDGHYHVDFDRLREDIRGCKMMIFCNPHNPGGRVWTREELEQIARPAAEEHVLVLSAAIHAAPTLAGYTHIPFAPVSADAASRTITFSAPSKAFNMPGIGSSYAIIVNPELNEKFQSFMEHGEFSEGNTLSYVGTIAAYNEGEEWLQDLCRFIDSNIDFTAGYLERNMPQVSMIRPQASYLIFLDFRKLGLEQEELVKLMIDKAGVAMNSGTMFGPEGKGFMRLNAGCTRAQLSEALERIAAAVNSLS